MRRSVGHSSVRPCGHRRPEALPNRDTRRTRCVGFGHRGIQASFLSPLSSLLLVGSGNSWPIKPPVQGLGEPGSFRAASLQGRRQGWGCSEARLQAAGLVHLRPALQTGVHPVPTISAQGHGSHAVSPVGPRLQGPTSLWKMSAT